ncbi:MAG: hypothetical protein VYA55_22000 [Pseudomonadota bacterium]|nr:hypothetical protein [Pseudomonadota bacterium]
MDAETVETLRKMFEEYYSDNGVITAAIVTVVGMLGVSILGFLSQLLTTNRVLRAERDRVLAQVNSERYARQHENWENIIVENVSGLLKSTDPEINSEIDPVLVTGFVLKIQLQLNTKDPNQNRVNQLVNEIALKANGWEGEQQASDLLKVHDQLLEATKILIYRPNINA